MNGKTGLTAVLAAVGGLLVGAFLGSQESDRGREEDVGEVIAALKAQAAAWNENDLDRFVAGYGDEEDLEFFSAGEVTKGRKAMHEFYKRSYRDRGEKLGKLTFSEVEVRRVGAEWATAWGRWHLTRVYQGQEERLEGLFTLVLRRFVEGWRIVHDHTSQSEEAQAVAAEQGVRLLLEAQERAWNAGELDEFMKGYWDSEELTFYSADKVEQGYAGLKERYRKRYQAEGKKGMGKLTFSALEVQALGTGWARARGRWKVVRQKEGKEERLEGLFTLVLRRMPEGWRIVHDHTSAAEVGKKE